jgi:hypothetical protein
MFNTTKLFAAKKLNEDERRACLDVRLLSALHHGLMTVDFLPSFEQQLLLGKEPCYTFLEYQAARIHDEYYVENPFTPFGDKLPPGMLDEAMDGPTRNCKNPTTLRGVAYMFEDTLEDYFPDEVRDKYAIYNESPMRKYMKKDSGPIPMLEFLLGDGLEIRYKETPVKTYEGIYEEGSYEDGSGEFTQKVDVYKVSWSIVFTGRKKRLPSSNTAAAAKFNAMLPFILPDNHGDPIDWTRISYEVCLSEARWAKE